MALFEKKEDLYEFIDKFKDADIGEMTVETSEIKIKIKKLPDVKNFGSKSVPDYPYLNDIKISQPNNNYTAEINTDNITVENFNSANNGLLSEKEKIVKAPFIGTFYSAPSPQSSDFVFKGKKVKKGEVLCIIEAMKVMNEIECEYDGEITEIYKQNADIVEYDAELFKISIL